MGVFSFRMNALSVVAGVLTARLAEVFASSIYYCILAMRSSLLLPMRVPSFSLAVRWSRCVPPIFVSNEPRSPTFAHSSSPIYPTSVCHCFPADTLCRVTTYWVPSCPSAPKGTHSSLLTRRGSARACWTSLATCCRTTATLCRMAWSYSSRPMQVLT